MHEYPNGGGHGLKTRSVGVRVSSRAPCQVTNPDRLAAIRLE